MTCVLRTARISNVEIVMINKISCDAEITTENVAKKLTSPLPTHVWESEPVPGHGFRIPGTGFRPNTLSMEPADSGFESLVGFGFLEVYSIFQSPGFRIPKQKFPGFRIPQAKLLGFRIQKFSRIPDSEAKICWISDSTSKNFPESGFRTPDSLRLGNL